MFEQRLDIFEDRAYRYRSKVDLEAPGLDLGEVEDVVDDVEQALRRLVGDLEELLLFFGVLHRPVHDEAQKTEDGCERGPQLVGGVGEELGLQPRCLESHGALLVQLAHQAGKGDRAAEKEPDLDQKLDVLDREIELARGGGEQHALRPPGRHQRQIAQMPDIVLRSQPRGELRGQRGRGRCRLWSAFAERRPARMIPGGDRMKAVLLKRLHARSGAGFEL